MIWMDKISVIAVILVIGLLAGGLGAYYSSAESMTITIEDKWIKPQGEDTKYLIQTSENGVMCVIDSIYYLSFDASDRYCQLKIGDTYNITKVGWRIPILSKYENILVIEEAE